MANFLSTIRTAASSLEALQDSVAVSQNNVTNASTPGYARQRMQLGAMNFSPQVGLIGGVSTLGVTSSRDSYAETTVHRQNSSFQQSNTLLNQVGMVDTALSLQDGAGIAGALDRMFTAFEQWSVNHSSAAAKQNVVTGAEDVARAFNEASQEIERSAQEAGTQLESRVDAVNQIAERLAHLNIARRESFGADPGVDSEMHRTLEELSGYIDFYTIPQEDASVTVMVGGSTPLVLGENATKLRVSYYNTAEDDQSIPKAHILNEAGIDITSQIKGGEIAGFAEFRNRVVPQYLGDATQQGDLNRLAEAVASRVNTILAAGRVPAEPYHMFLLGTPPTATAIARTLKVIPGLASAVLSAADPEAGTVNGLALKLSKLAQPLAAEDKLDGLSYMAYYGKIAATAGTDVTTAKADSDIRGALLAQARSLRADTSGVSLDEEAARLVEYQRAYQAAARMVSVLDELTEMAVNLGRN